MYAKLATPLNNPYDISRYLNCLDRGRINSATADKLRYLCNVLRSTMETAELQERVTLLERRNPKEKWPAADWNAVDGSGIMRSVVGGLAGFGVKRSPGSN